MPRASTSVTDQVEVPFATVAIVTNKSATWSIGPGGM